MSADEKISPSVVHAEPVLPVEDVSATVKYWHEVLGFPDHWTWGTPPNHGGVSWLGAGFIQFSLDPELASVSKGNSIWLRVNQLSTLYNLHRNNANIVQEIIDRPWGFSEYVVEDLNGYYITFAAPTAEKDIVRKKFPENISITSRNLTKEENHYLNTSVGWGDSEDAVREDINSKAVLTLVATDTTTNQAVGCVLLFGDGGGFYYIKNLIVHPNWQGQSVGTRLMETLMNWIETHAPKSATIGLFTGEHLARFYRKFGFVQSVGMYRVAGKS